VKSDYWDVDKMKCLFVLCAVPIDVVSVRCGSFGTASRVSL